MTWPYAQDLNQYPQDFFHFHHFNAYDFKILEKYSLIIVKDPYGKIYGNIVDKI
jgi:hypothetical protein